MSHARVVDRARIAALEVDIQKLERSIRAFRSEQSLIRARLNLYKYPVSTLPNEIVSEIFIHFLPDYPLCPPLSGILSPTVLTHICRKWREIALATPALWRAIPLDWILHDSASEAQLHVVEDWLRRSRCGPLSIRMDDDIYMSETPVDKILETLLAQRARLEHIKLVFPVSYLLNVTRPMPQLHELDIRIPQHDAAFPHSAALEEVPRLRAVTLDFSPPANFLPWSQLTSLTLVGTEPHECTPVLTQTVNLTYCKLVISGDNASVPNIRLPLLECLILVHLHVEEPPTRFLNVFIVPALRRLQVPEKFLRQDAAALACLILKSGCELREVCITGELIRSRRVWSGAFPSVRFSFNPDLTHWYGEKAHDAFEP